MSRWPALFAVYAAGDAAWNGSFSSLQRHLQTQLRHLQAVITNAHVAGAAQLDALRGPSLRYVLDPEQRFAPLPLGEANTGEPTELVKFVDWANQTCPAEAFVLVLSGHGLAFQDERTRELLGSGRGAASQMILRATNPFSIKTAAQSVLVDAVTAVAPGTRSILMDESDFLSVEEMRFALEKTAALLGRPIDVVVFDACLMSNLEILVEIAPMVRSVAGAIDEISGAGLNLAGAARTITTHISDPKRRNGADGSFFTAGEMAKAFSTSYEARWVTDSCVAIDLESSPFHEGVGLFTRFAGELLDWLHEHPEAHAPTRRAISHGSKQMFRYSSQSLCDLRALRQALAAPLPDELVQTLDEAIEHFEKAVVHRSVGRQYADALGISVFCPTDSTQFATNRRDYRLLLMGQTTGWLPVLDLIYGT